MTPADVATVLAKIAAFDRRTVGAADVAAWHEILAPYELPAALEAVTRHHRNSTDWCRPAHLVVHLKTIKAERDKAASAPLALPGRFEDDPARTARMDRGMSACRDVIAALRKGLTEKRPRPEIGQEPA